MRFAGVLFVLALTPALAAAATLEGRWVGSLQRTGEEWAVVLDLAVDGPRGSATVDLPDYGLFRRPARAVRLQGDAVSFVLRALGDSARFQGRVQGGRLAGQWSGMGRDARVVLERVGEAPPAVQEIPVHFQSGHVMLAGTLLRPSGAGPFPAVVWLQGPARGTRGDDGYRDRAVLLAQNGVASLIYDRRGAGDSEGTCCENFHSELTHDGLAGFAALRARDDVRADRVGLAASGTAGLVLAEVASRAPEAAFVVALGVPAVMAAHLDDFRVRHRMLESGAPEASVRPVLEARQIVHRFHRFHDNRPQADSALAALRAGPWWEAAELPEPPVAVLSPVARDNLFFDPLPAWRAVRAPVLALWGRHDDTLPAVSSSRQLGDALAESGNRAATMRVYPKAGRGLAQPGAVDEPWAWRITPGSYDLLVEWVRIQAGLARGDQAPEPATPAPGQP